MIFVLASVDECLRFYRVSWLSWNLSVSISLCFIWDSLSYCSFFSILWSISLNFSLIYSLFCFMSYCTCLILVCTLICFSWDLSLAISWSWFLSFWISLLRLRMSLWRRRYFSQTWFLWSSSFCLISSRSAYLLWSSLILSYFIFFIIWEFVNPLLIFSWTFLSSSSTFFSLSFHPFISDLDPTCLPPSLCQAFIVLLI